MHSIERHIHSFFTKLPTAPYYVAVSGGVDSIVLMQIMHKLTYSFTVLHVNYQLRGRESDLDEELVRNQCETLGIPVLVLRYNLKSQLKISGGNLQDEARKVRYGFFSEQLQKNNGWLVLAHHADDQVETFFLHLARKSGVMGMSCMLPVHESRVRPLLPFERSEIIAYATENGLIWREDASNEQLFYRRNILRHVLIPEMESQCEQLKQKVLLLVGAFQRTQLLLEAQCKSLVKKIEDNGSLTFSDFDSLKEEEKIELLRQLGLPSVLLSALNNVRFSQKGKKIHAEFGAYKTIFRESDSFFFQKNQDVDCPQLLMEKVAALPNCFDKNKLYLNEQSVQGKLRIRHWRVSDRMKPIGMKGSKLISDILSDAKVPSSQRAYQYVVEDETKILWCVGHCISREALPDGAASIISISITH
jgi:tRNA(Ile)-lysidine synthase